MMLLKPASKKKHRQIQPLLGTFIRIECESGHSDPYSLVMEAFCKIAELEKIFNRFDPESELSRFNRNSKAPIGEDLKSVLHFSAGLYEISGGNFNPYCVQDGMKHWDLNGIAKGYIVDQTVQWLLAKDPSLSGSVNAGGDVRFFGGHSYPVHLRLGLKNSLLRKFESPYAAIATSSLWGKNINSGSQTTYRGTLASHIPDDFTVCAMAESCMEADALTKIVIFSEIEIIEKVFAERAAAALVFTADNLVNVFGHL